MSYNDTARVLEQLPALMAGVRARRGLSIRAAAEEAGLPHTTWYHVETGHVSPSIDRAVLILQWLEEQPDYATATS